VVVGDTGFQMGEEMRSGERTIFTTKSGSDSLEGGRRPWGRLYCVALTSAILCAVGYRLEAAVGQATLLQFAVVVIVLGLLFVWTRVHHSVLLDQSAALPRSTTRLFSILRVPLSREPNAVRHQRHERFLAPGGRTSSTRPATHPPLR
jgi:hypothetical protein